MVSYKRIFGLIIAISGILLVQELFNSLIQYNIQHGCGTSFCEGDEDVFLALLIYFIPILAVEYYHDGPIRTKWRNLVFYAMILIFSIFIINFIENSLGYATLLLFTAYDSGKKSALLGNKKMMSSLGNQAYSLSQSTNALTDRSSSTHFLIDGVIGFGVLFTTSISLTVTFDFIPVALSFFLFPEIDFLVISLNIFDLTVFLSLFLMVLKSGIFYRNKLVSGRITGRILKLFSFPQFFKILFKIVMMVLFLVILAFMFLAFVRYDSVPLVHPFIEALMFALWGISYVINV